MKDKDYLQIKLEDACVRAQWPAHVTEPSALSSDTVRWNPSISLGGGSAQHPHRLTHNQINPGISGRLTLQQAITWPRFGPKPLLQGPGGRCDHVLPDCTTHSAQHAHSLTGRHESLRCNNRSACAEDTIDNENRRANSAQNS